MRFSVFLLSLLLCSCGDYSDPKPYQTCLKYTDKEMCGRGGCTYVCGTWGIGCPEPTKLVNGPDNKLACRLEDK